MARPLARPGCASLLCLGAAVALLGFAAPAAVGGDARGGGAAPTEGPVAGFERQSAYVEMPDGVNLAVDIWRDPTIDRAPALLEFTRYWRWTLTDPPLEKPHTAIEEALQRGYAYVAVDVRGTGASTGVRESEFSLDEARDMYHVVDWLVDQPWSNGRAATLGISYAGNTAEMAALFRHPALVATVPRFTDFDWYTSIIMPGGLKNEYIATRWGDNVRRLDLNDATVFGPAGDGPRVLGVQPVQGDSDRAMLNRAVRQHRGNTSIADMVGALVYRDEYPVARDLEDEGGRAVSIHRMAGPFAASAVPMYHWGSWFDAGTAAGILARFRNWDTPYRYVIGAWSHGAGHDANPYMPCDAAPRPDIATQYEQIFAFLEPYTRGGLQAEPPRKELLYFTVGENRWKRTEHWPPDGAETRRLWFAAAGKLSPRAPAEPGTYDSYSVDFAVGSGSSTRWSTQLGGGDVCYADRGEADARLLTYTSDPLEHPLEITGTPVLSLQVASTLDDGNFIAYLEDVAPDGTVTLLTEGGLRAIHRSINEAARRYETEGPWHSFDSRDGELLEPGVVTELRFGLLPISARIARGHRLRLALAGHDRDTFRRVPDEGSPTWRVARNRSRASWLDLPIVGDSADTTVSNGDRE